MKIAVDFLGNEGSSLGDQTLHIKPKPFLGIELASLDPFLLLLQHRLRNVSVTCVVEVYEGWVDLEITQSAFSEFSYRFDLIGLLLKEQTAEVNCSKKSHDLSNTLLLSLILHFLLCLLVILEILQKLIA